MKRYTNLHYVYYNNWPRAMYDDVAEFFPDDLQILKTLDETEGRTILKVAETFNNDKVFSVSDPNEVPTIFVISAEGGDCDEEAEPVFDSGAMSLEIDTLLDLGLLTKGQRDKLVELREQAEQRKKEEEERQQFLKLQQKFGATHD